jgi:putative aminopeptidase
MMHWQALTRRWVGAVLCLFFMAPSSAAERSADSFSVLKTLLEVPGVSGHEEAVRAAIRDLLPDWARSISRVDSKGNLIVEAGKGGKRILFVAHMDETGYAITSIEADGTARVRSLGGFFHTLYEAHPVIVHTRRGVMGALVRPRGDYQAPEAGSDFLEGNVVVDFGTEDRKSTLGLGVAVGDWITVAKQFRKLAGRMGSGRAVDDRAGCTALVEAARKMEPSRLRNAVTLAWSVEEEIGLKGAEAIAASSSYDVVFAVDTFVSSDSPLESHGFAFGLLGSGPVLRAMDNSNLAPAEELEKVRRLASERGLPLQIGLTHGGNDGSVFPAFGAVDVPLSWPTTYSHSAVELIHEADLTALGDLVALLGESW